MNIIRIENNKEGCQPFNFSKKNDENTKIGVIVDIGENCSIEKKIIHSEMA